MIESPAVYGPVDITVLLISAIAGCSSTERVPSHATLGVWYKLILDKASVVTGVSSSSRCKTSDPSMSDDKHAIFVM